MNIYPHRLVFWGENLPGVRIGSEPNEDPGNNFEVEMTTAAKQKIDITNGELRLKNGRYVINIEKDAKKVKASIYIGEKGPNQQFIEVKVTKQDNSEKTFWIDTFGSQTLFFEPKNGAIQAGDLIRLLSPKE